MTCLSERMPCTCKNSLLAGTLEKHGAWEKIRNTEVEGHRKFNRNTRVPRARWCAWASSVTNIDAEHGWSCECHWAGMVHIMTNNEDAWLWPSHPVFQWRKQASRQASKQASNQTNKASQSKSKRKSEKRQQASQQANQHAQQAALKQSKQGNATQDQQAKQANQARSSTTIRTSSDDHRNISWICLIDMTNELNVAN